MKADDDLFDVLGAIYAAAQRQEGWTDVLHRVSGLFGAAAATIVTVEPRSSSLRFFASYNVPAEAVSDYRSEIVRIDPRLRYVQRNPGLDVFYDYLHHDERTMDHDDYYAWLWRVAGFRYYAAVRVLDSPEATAFFTIQRARGQGHVETRDIELLRLLTPHLRSAAELTVRLGEADFRGAAAYEALHRLTMATILLDGAGRILFANAGAEAMLRSEELLRARDRRLAAIDGPTDARLQQLIRCGLHDLEAPSRAVPREMAIARPEGASITLRVNPLLAGVCPIFGPEAALVLFIHDPDAATRPPADRLRARYGLTTAEAQLCRALLEGLSVNAYAERAGISVDTVRSHLKRVLAKTGTDRQAGLIALLMREAPQTL